MELHAVPGSSVSGPYLSPAYATLRYVAELGNEMGFGTDRIAVAGDSVGADMTAATRCCQGARGSGNSGLYCNRCAYADALL